MTATVFVFLLLFHMPSFGGDVRVRVEFQTQDGCERLSKVMLKQMEEMSVNKFEIVQACVPEVR